MPVPVEPPPPGVTMEEFIAQWNLIGLLWALYHQDASAFYAEYGPDEEPRATWDRGGSMADGVVDDADVDAAFLFLREPIARR